MSYSCQVVIYEMLVCLLDSRLSSRCRTINYARKALVWWIKRLEKSTEKFSTTKSKQRNPSCKPPTGGATFADFFQDEQLLNLSAKMNSFHQNIN